MYIFVCSTLRVILQGFVTQNATSLTLTLPQLGRKYYNISWHEGPLGELHCSTHVDSLQYHLINFILIQSNKFHLKSYSVKVVESNGNL